MDFELFLDDLKEWAQKNTKMIVLCVVAFIVLLVGGKVRGSQRAAVTNASNQVAQMKSQIQVDKTKSDATASVTSDGLDESRVKNDEAVLEKFFKVTFSFKNEDEYVDARSDAKTTLASAESEEFFETFYQELSEELAEGSQAPTDSHLRKSGEKYDCAYKESTSYVSAIEDGIYTYISDVTLTSNSKDYEVVILSSVDADGNITHIEGYTVTQ